MKQPIDKNAFDIKKYFKPYYGMGNRPALFKLHGFFKLLYILIIPIIMHFVSRSKRAAWDREFLNRHNTWSKEFDKALDEKIASLHVEQLALEKLGLSESDLESGNVQPFNVLSQERLPKRTRYNTPDKIIRSDVNVLRRFIFTEKQVHVYEITFCVQPDMPVRVEGGIRYLTKEEMKEFFYQDITSITTTHSEELQNPDDNQKGESIFKKGKKGKKANKPKKEQKPAKKDASAENNDEVAAAAEDPEEKIKVTKESFTLVVPGDSMSFYIYPTPGSDAVYGSIVAMRDLIRSKKDRQEALIEQIKKAQD